MVVPGSRYILTGLAVPADFHDKEFKVTPDWIFQPIIRNVNFETDVFWLE